MMNHLWQSTAFAAFAALLAFAFRRKPARVRYWIWMAASLKFLLPFSLLMALGERVQWQSAPVVVREVASSAIDDLGAPFASGTVAAASVTVLSGENILIAMWLCGFFAVLIGFFILWRRTATMVGSADALTKGRETDVILRVQSRFGMRYAVPVVIARTSIEPGVFGIFRPVLILPAGIADRLSESQLEAIVAHELCHVQRRGNLAALVHMAVEAIFWFHPAVWWLGSRLIEERERACDEEVLRRGGDSRTYAESILKSCEFYLQSPVACFSGVTGGELGRRIERIMLCGHSLVLGVRARLVLVAVALAAIAIPMFMGVASAPVGIAQTKQSSETFDVVSIKMAAPGMRGNGFTTSPGRLQIINYSLADCILLAYGIQSFQLVANDLPKQHYTIVATAPTHPSRAFDSRYSSMLQTLLADRFQLKLHRDSRILPVYALEVAKGGSKMKVSEAPGMSTRSTQGHVMVTGITMQEWATYLTRRTGRPVVDLTGLKELYDFNLDWSPSEAEASLEPPDPDHPRSTDLADGPSLFTALQEQLGLKLQGKKLPVEILIVDSAAAASGNE
ncbi:MAG TPA: M56 family metallopeptidase [Bryobacteraceae bacterium]|nr:M56 family metallopeptidase [Bryobacteraceae bacterium]